MLNTRPPPPRNEKAQIVQPNGAREEIPAGGIIAIIEYPPAQPDGATTQRAATALNQIDALLAKFPRAQFPQIHAKLVPLAAKWRSAQQLAATAATSLAAATVRPPSSTQGLIITTTDGQRFDGVTSTKVDGETLSFEHSAGVASVPLAKLTPELQRKFNYDPKVIEAAKAAKAAKVAADVQIAQAAAIKQKDAAPVKNEATVSPLVQSDAEMNAADTGDQAERQKAGVTVASHESALPRSPGAKPGTTIRLAELTLAGCKSASANFREVVQQICHPTAVSYVGRLTALAERLQQAGDLNALLPVRDEIKNIQAIKDFTEIRNPNYLIGEPSPLQDALPNQVKSGELSSLRDAFIKQVETTVSECREDALDICDEAVRQLTVNAKIEEARALTTAMTRLGYERDGGREIPLEKKMPVGGPRMVLGRAVFQGIELMGQPFRLAAVNGDTLAIYPPDEPAPKPVPSSVTDYALRRQVRQQAVPLLAARLFVPAETDVAVEHNFQLFQGTVLQVLPQGLLIKAAMNALGSTLKCNIG